MASIAKGGERGLPMLVARQRRLPTKLLATEFRSSPSSQGLVTCLLVPILALLAFHFDVFLSQAL